MVSPPTAVRHIALFRWKDDVRIDPQQIAAEIASIAGAHGVLTFVAGAALGYGMPTYDYAVIGDFPSRESYLSYRESEEHRRYMEHVLRPAASDIAAVQIEVNQV